jgi:hypothetical protein
MPETGQVCRLPAMQEPCHLKREKTIDGLVAAGETAYEPHHPAGF